MKMWQSRTLWLAGLTAMSLGPLGCVVEDADDSAFEFNWDVGYVADGRVSCADAGTPFVQMDARNLHTGAVYSTKPSCDLGYARSEVLPLGQYEVTMSLLDAKNRPVSQIVGGPFEVNRYDLTPLRAVLFQVQTFQLDWNLATEGARDFLTCAQAGARSVELITQLGTEEPEKFVFACEDGGGITQAIRVGRYAWRARLLDTAGQALSDTGLRFIDVGDSVPAKLDPIVFTVR
jgi:hypothetical protein